MTHDMKHDMCASRGVTPGRLHTYVLSTLCCMDRSLLCTSCCSTLMSTQCRSQQNVVWPSKA